MTAFYSESQAPYLFYGCTLGYLSATFSMAYVGPIGKQVLLFSTLYCLSFFFLLGLLWTFPTRWSIQTQLGVVFLMALLARLAFFAFPASDDVNRYIWEGYILNKGVNPYLHAPDDPVLRPLTNEIWQGINHKDLPACYPPLALLFFRLAAFFSPTPSFFKMVIISFDLATIGLLGRLLRAHGVPPRRLLLYALNPLVLLFIAGEGHLDVIQAFFVCLSFLLFTQKRDGWGFFSLGCAVMTKYFAIIFAPFWINAKNWKKASCLLGALVVFYLPFWGTSSQFFTSVLPFGTAMHYNDSLTMLFRAVLGLKTVWVSIGVLGVCLLVILLFVNGPLRSSYVAAGCLLLLLGTLHPWYLVLITPFLVFFPSRAWLYLHIAVVFTFPVRYVQYHTGVFQEIQWLKLFEYLPFYGLLIWDVFKNRRVLPALSFEPVSRISVVIPTLNESGNIGRCLAAFQNEKAVMEAIVVDGGSTDKTREIARNVGCRVVTAKKGRGNQIRTGIKCCQGDVILVLHADCVIRENTPAHIIQRLNRKGQCIGGALGMEFFHETVRDRVISWLNNARARWTGISFGDQAQFFRKEALSLIGGFPDLMMMEDLELSMRLKENGQLCFIPHGVTVSRRRWEKVGFWSNGTWIMWRCLCYLVQRRLGAGEASARDSYERYYKLSRA